MENPDHQVIVICHMDPMGRSTVDLVARIQALTHEYPVVVIDSLSKAQETIKGTTADLVILDEILMGAIERLRIIESPPDPYFLAHSPGKHKAQWKREIKGRRS